MGVAVFTKIHRLATPFNLNLKIYSDWSKNSRFSNAHVVNSLIFHYRMMFVKEVLAMEHVTLSEY